MTVSTRMHNQPKPVHARFRAEYATGRGFEIIDPTGRVVGREQNRAIALNRAEALQKEADTAAKRGPRPCLCCGREFLSDGIHNRMCNPCRGRADPLDRYGYAGGEGGRKARRGSGF
ncbi:hypothetical protein [Pararhodobacter aggregans]|uniref:Uncharacterized protein n=1 Tax=Pararhodobacter aggregans TaxID=404875 RepID=A0A2T7UMM1_9RHOB|nr:hypothetical protein [Pararhodobacter aggregans]PTW99138.1 hypothetical protein C8N33_11740 [Pararhodobacter aggregans]PVE45861.1 hypothetical protein DDE23_18755 [Pararhodobacter aggregans]